MRHVILLALISPLAARAAPPVEADSFATAADIHRFCQRDLGHPVCTGYISGVHDTLAMLVAAGVPGLEPYSVCVPPQADARAVSQAVEQYLEARPELLDRGAAGVVARALHVRFPCRTARAGRARIDPIVVTKRGN